MYRLHGVIPTGAVFPAEGGISRATYLAGDPFGFTSGQATSPRLNCGSAQNESVGGDSTRQLRDISARPRTPLAVL